MELTVCHWGLRLVVLLESACRNTCIVGLQLLYLVQLEALLPADTSLAAAAVAEHKTAAWAASNRRLRRDNVMLPLSVQGLRARHTPSTANCSTLH